MKEIFLNVDKDRLKKLVEKGYKTDNIKIDDIKYYIAFKDKNIYTYSIMEKFEEFESNYIDYKKIDMDLEVEEVKEIFLNVDKDRLKKLVEKGYKITISFDEFFSEIFGDIIYIAFIDKKLYGWQDMEIFEEFENVYKDFKKIDMDLEAEEPTVKTNYSLYTIGSFAYAISKYWVNGDDIDYYKIEKVFIDSVSISLNEDGSEYVEYWVKSLDGENFQFEVQEDFINPDKDVLFEKLKELWGI
jgi:hypothetical protein